MTFSCSICKKSCGPKKGTMETWELQILQKSIASGEQAKTGICNVCAAIPSNNYNNKSTESGWIRVDE